MAEPNRPVRVRVDPHGPIYVDGPVEVSAEDGEPLLVERFRVAICACGRSDRYPLCDGTHLAATSSAAGGQQRRPTRPHNGSAPSAAEG